MKLEQMQLEQNATCAFGSAIRATTYYPLPTTYHLLPEKLLNIYYLLLKAYVVLKRIQWNHKYGDA